MSDLYFSSAEGYGDKAAEQRKKNAESQRQYRIRKKEQEENLQNENAYLWQTVSTLKNALQSKTDECQRLENILISQVMPPAPAQGQALFPQSNNDQFHADMRYPF